MKILAIHKDSTKFVLIDCKAEDVKQVGNDCLAAFRRDLHDPDITDARVVIIEIEGECKVLKSTELQYINRPPSEQPATITTHTR